MTKRNRVYAAVYLVLIRGEQILLARRFQTGFEDGNYSLPSGHLDGGETATAGLIREAREEIGIEIAAEDLRFLHVMHRNSMDRREYHDYYFSAETYTNPIQNMEPEKCDDIRWFPLAQLPSNLIDYVRQAIRAIENGQAFSQYGW